MCFLSTIRKFGRSNLNYSVESCRVLQPMARRLTLAITGPPGRKGNDMSEELNRPDGSELIGRVRQHTPGPWHWEDGEFSALPRLMAQAVEVCNFGDREQYYPTEGDRKSTRLNSSHQ